MAGLVDRDLAELAQAELGVARGRLAARGRPAVQLTQEDPQRRGLDLVEPRVVADVLERLLRLRAVEAEHPDALRELGVSHGDEAAVAEAEEVLRRIEAEGRRDARCRAMSGEPNACAASSMIGRPSSRELVERRRAAEEVHRKDRLRPRGDLPLHVCRIEVQRDRVDVDEDGRRLAPRDRLGGRVERERRGRSPRRRGRRRARRGR